MSVRRFLSGSFSAARLLANTVGKSLSAAVSTSSLKATQSVSYLQATATAIALQAKIEAAFFVQLFLLSDNGSASDEQTLEVTKPQTDAAGTTDSHVFTYTKVAGATEGQTYCDITYFEEDYIQGPQVDHITLTDVFSLLITYGRNLTEDPAITDAYAYTVTKPFTEAMGGTDLSVLLLTKPFADSFGVTDSDTLSFAKGVTETPALIDTRTFDFTKVISEQLFSTDDLDGEASAEDDQEIQFVKTRSDSSALTDNFSKTVTFSRTFTEAPAANEEHSFDVTKPLTEAPTASDSFGKVVAFSRSFTEAGSASDSDTLNTGKNLSDNGGIIDAQVVQFTKASSDSSVAADSGSLRSQGYCDFTYFAEDYVGASRTFT